MTDFQWQGDGPDFTIHAVGRVWRLDLNTPRPGLSWSDGRSAAGLLALHHLSAVGWCDGEAFDPRSLLKFERHRGRVEATFAPRAWHGLMVRAAWEPTPKRDGMDLEIQVSTASSTVFRRLEVAVGSHWSEITEASPTGTTYRVEPRDVRAAALSYDGREALGLLQATTTMPVPGAAPHVLAPLAGLLPGDSTGPSYIEMVRPDDCARRMIGVRTDCANGLPGWFWIRYGLFGHDLEKGVVLRGRIRGIWIDSGRAKDEIERLHRSFLTEPPALGP